MILDDIQLAWRTNKEVNLRLEEYLRAEAQTLAKLDGKTANAKRSPLNSTALPP